MLNITKGKIDRAQKVVIYGSEGIGKSSLAAKFPDPLIIDTEGGTAHMDVRRIDRPESWEELLGIVKEVAATPNVCETLVLDTADWAEQLVTNYICAKYKQNSIESFGYGKGYTYLSEEFARLLALFDSVIAAQIHVVITAHAKMRKFEQPDEMGAYDRWEMKLSKQVAPLVKEWCDLLLFCNYQTYVVTTETNKQKAQGGKRVMYTSHHPAWDAKSRVELPPVLDLDYKTIAHVFERKAAPAANAPQTGTAPKTDAAQTNSNTATQETSAPVAAPPSLAKLRQQMKDSGVTEDEVKAVIEARGHYPAAMPMEEYEDAFITGWVFKYWTQILDMIRANRAARKG